MAGAGHRAIPCLEYLDHLNDSQSLNRSIVAQGFFAGRYEAAMLPASDLCRGKMVRMPLPIGRFAVSAVLIIAEDGTNDVSTHNLPRAH